MVESNCFTLTRVSSTPLSPTTTWSDALPSTLWFLMSGVTPCGLKVFKPAYVVLRGDTMADPAKRFVAVGVQSTRLYDSKLSSRVSLSSGGSPNTRVWLYSYCTDSRRLTL